MNLTPECDVVVIGGGPAGAIAAYTLARHGIKTVLLEKKEKYRDKVCGDALIPDSLQLLNEIGFLPELKQKGQAINKISLYSPSRNKVDLEARFICYPRRDLDQFLRDKAEEAGAMVYYETKAINREQTDQNMTVHAQSKSKGNLNFIAKMVLLTTGASASTLNHFELKHLESTDAIAGRAYYEVSPKNNGEELIMVWDKQILPGYGWAFPLGNNRYNVGVGLLKKGSMNIRETYEKFISESPLMQKLLQDANCITPFKGAPLQCGLKGCQPSNERILVAGEAIGTTYHLSGEGIGKAMETAALAAEIIMKALEQDNYSAKFLKQYDFYLKRRFADRFNQYYFAQQWLRFPWVIDFLIKKAAHSQAIRQKMQDMLTENTPPSTLISLYGLLKSIFH